MMYSFDHDRSRRCLAALVAAAVLGVGCVGCGPSFRTELTVDPELVRNDPLLTLEPEGATVAGASRSAGTSVYVGETQTWEGVEREAFAQFLVDAHDQGTRFHKASCRSPQAGVAYFDLRGSKPLGPHVGTANVVYQLEENELEVEVLLRRDAEVATSDEPPIDLSELPPLETDGCDGAEIEELNRWLR